jgi:hypothetical protein
MARLAPALAEWAARNAKIRRVWVSDGRAEDASGGNGGVDIALELQPVPDSEESLAVWIANADKWRLQLQAMTGRSVELDCIDPDRVTGTVDSACRENRVLVYERDG